MTVIIPVSASIALLSPYDGSVKLGIGVSEAMDPSLQPAINIGKLSR